MGQLIFMFSMVIYWIFFNVYVFEIVKITDSFMDFIGIGYLTEGPLGIISLPISIAWTLILYFVFITSLLGIPDLIQSIKEKQMGN